MSCDIAIPHLLEDADVTRALRAMHSKLRAGGLLPIGIRDYDTALIDRPATAPPQLIAGPPRRLFVRLHDWDAPDSPHYAVRFFILTDNIGPLRQTFRPRRSSYQRREALYTAAAALSRYRDSRGLRPAIALSGDPMHRQLVEPLEPSLDELNIGRFWVDPVDSGVSLESPWELPRP